MVLKFLKSLISDKNNINKGPNLKNHLDMKFEEKLISFDFDNVGSYPKESRTKQKS